MIQRLARVWKSRGPYKLLDFSWKLLQDRLPTRHNLFICLIVVAGSSVGCMGCLRHVESVYYLFFLCEVASTLWYKVLERAGIPKPLTNSILGVFEMFRGLGLGKNPLFGLVSILHSIV